MLQNIAGAVRRAARVLNPVTVIDVVQQQCRPAAIEGLGERM